MARIEISYRNSEKNQWSHQIQFSATSNSTDLHFAQKYPYKSAVTDHPNQSRTQTVQDTTLTCFICQSIKKASGITILQYYKKKSQCLEI